jgi:hypothetical protein
MPRYHFNVVNDVTFQDTKGLLLSDHAAATAHAEKLVTAIATRAPQCLSPVSVVVTDEAGDRVLQIDVPPERDAR